MSNSDLVVVGAGPGGYVAAIRAAQLGRKVTIIERESLGGICLNWGCIPTKALLKSAHLFEEIAHADSFGLSVDGASFNFDKIIQRSRDVSSKISGGVAFLMRKNKIDVVMGDAKFTAKGVIEVKNKTDGKTTTINYKDVIIATGARARPLPGVEVDGEVVHNYRSILNHRKQPKKLLVIGAGAIGIEFAYFFSSLGTEVTVVEMSENILPVEDSEISTTLRKIFEKKGMQIHTQTSVSSVNKTKSGVTATLKSQAGDINWSGDAVLAAVGVVANIENIGLEKLGVELSTKGFIKVDQFMRTNLPNVFAIGDVVGPPWLAHVASHEGLVAAETACNHLKHPMKYDNVPGCTYCQPQVASVGLTEKACKEKGLKYKVGKVPFTAIGKAIATGAPEGMVKVIIDADLGEVLGVHILQAEATELITEAVAIRSHEGIAASVLDTIHPHPTLSEAIMEAMAAAMGRPINT